MRLQISVVVPTHNPVPVRFARALDGLKHQTLPDDQWELVIVDNATPDATVVPSFDLSWHGSAKVVREERLGLTWARLSGINASHGDYLVFVDDDNVLCVDYLENVAQIFKQNLSLGAIGGKSIPEFEIKPEPWMKEFYGCLALRDHGEVASTFSYVMRGEGVGGGHKEYPHKAPIGAGMALRRSAAERYVANIANDGARLALDRTGKSLTSGGDNDLVMTVLDEGWTVGYFPQLELSHLIPASRLSLDYLAKLNRASTRSWVKVLNMHGIRLWNRVPRWTLLPRKIKSYITYRAWASPAAYVRWQGACGQFEALSELTD